MNPPVSRSTHLLATAVAALLAAAGSQAGDWPQWRGPLRDGHAAPDESLPAQFPPSLEPSWTSAVGTSFASPVVVGERLFHVDEVKGQETAHAVDTRTGKDVWSVSYGPASGDEWGTGPRCSPVADDGRLFVQSIQGEFACLDQRDGSRLWGFSFTRDFNVRYVGGADQVDAAARRRGNSGAPVIVGDRIYVSVGATNGASVVCFDKRSGSELWRAGRDEAAYAALTAGKLAGRTHVVAYTAFSLLGLDAERGTILWRLPLKTAANRHAATPIFSGDDLIISSHSLGTRSFHVAATSDGTTATEAWAAPQLKTSLATAVLVEGHLYGQGPDRNLQCLSATTGTVMWSQPGYGEKPLTGYSSTVAAGKRLLVLSETGQLTLVEANPSAYRELGRQQVCGKNWNHPALAHGTLYVRDQRNLLAIPLSTEAPR